MPRRPSSHVDSAAAVGARLKAARHAAGLTQRDLSFEGCTSAYVSRIEAGARIPSLQVLREFAKRLNVSADYLATGTDVSAEVDPFFEAEVAFRLGEVERAQALYEELQDSSDAESALHGRAKVGLGQIALHSGDMAEAIGLLESAMAANLPAADAALAAVTLGRAYVSQGRYPESFDIFSSFLDAARQHNDPFETLRFSVQLANALIDSGNYPRAEEILGGAIDLARQVLDPMLKASLYWSQSRLYAAEGNSELAAEYAQLTVATLKNTEHTVQAARALLLLAHIENDRGNAETALELVEEGEPVANAGGTAVDQTMFALERARAMDSLGDQESAASLVLGAIGPLKEASPVTAARGYAAAASFFRTRGDRARALELYELAAEQFPSPDRHLAEVLSAMAEIYEEQGDAKKALELLKQAVAAKSGVTAGNART